MRLLTLVVLIFEILGGCAAQAYTQDKAAPIIQQAGECSVNVSGNNNTTASLVCNNVNPKLAGQIRAIINNSRRNESALKEISGKLGLILDQMYKEAIAPEIALRLVYPKSPALLLVNESEAVARDIKWSSAIWNMDLPDRNDPLPIPTQIFDWLRPNDQGGPQDLFDTSLVAPLLKPGNRLFGSVSVVCPKCARGRTYVVYIVWGKGGWFSEVKNEFSGHLLIPPNYSFSKSARDEFFEQLEAGVPAQSREPIAEHP